MGERKDYRAKRKDAGCEHSTSCLRCPLSKCAHDAPVSAKMKKIQQDEGVRNLHSQGWVVRDLAQKFNLSESMIYYILKGK